MMLAPYPLYVPKGNFVVLSEVRHWYELVERGMKPQKMEEVSPRVPYLG